MPNVSKQDVYFQFPIRAVYLSGKHPDCVSEQERKSALYRAIDYACWNYGKKLRDGYEQQTGPEDPGGTMDRAECIAAKANMKDCNSDNSEHVAYALGMEKLHVKGGSAPHGVRQAKELAKASTEFGNAQVRLRSDLVWGCLTYNRPSWRELCVLAACYAIIGNKKCAIIRYERVRTMAQGVSGEKEFTIFGNVDGLLTPSQVKTTTVETRITRTDCRSQNSDEK
jgi:hypothetical protein